MNLEEYTIQREETIIESVKRRILLDKLTDEDGTVEELVRELNTCYSFEIIMLTNIGAIVVVYDQGEPMEDNFVYVGGDLFITDRYEEALGELCGQVVERYNEMFFEEYFNNENKYIIENDFIVERDTKPKYTITITLVGNSATYEEWEDEPLRIAIENAILELGYSAFEGDLLISVKR